MIYSFKFIQWIIYKSDNGDKKNHKSSRENYINSNLTPQYV